MNRPKHLKSIARRAGITTAEAMSAAEDLGLPTRKVLGDWLLDTDVDTARRFADHLAARLEA